MAKPKILTHIEGPIDVANAYGYPDGTYVSIRQCEDGEVHDILGPDASPVTNYANAPNGSSYVPLTATAGDMKLWRKYGAAYGAKDGAWKATGALT